MRIRPLAEADIPAVIDLWRRSDLVRPWNDPESDIRLCLESGHGSVFLREAENGAPVAATMVGHDGHRGWIYYLAVEPMERRAGHARALISFAERWLRDRNVPKVMLMIRPENDDVVEVYERLGYARESRVVMSRRLDGRERPETIPPSGPLPPVEITKTYLEMTAPPSGRPVAAPTTRLALLRLERPDIGFYRYLYDAVGRPWKWVDRKRLDDESLATVIRDDRVEIYVLYAEGNPAGYAELDRRSPPDIELAYFGLTPPFIGRGLGRYLLDCAIRTAWTNDPARLWVHTCTEDHPHALSLYQRHGFRAYAQETTFLDINVPDRP
jgi:ribosomal protein S18 acetylase RimI-like enzyme